MSDLTDAIPVDLDDAAATILHLVRILGFAQRSGLAPAAGLDDETLSVALADLTRRELVLARTGGSLQGWTASPAGIAADDALLASDLAARDARGGVEAGYARFVELNQPLKQLCSDWQVRGAESGTPVVNDHSDAEYDARVVAALGKLHGSAEAMLGDLADAVPRFGRYGLRLDGAWRRIEAGDGAAFTTPMSESYHDVWMHLHADLLSTLARERSSEDGH
jgi:hypothetical protein